MRQLADCSGPWAGFWIQNGFRGVQRLELTWTNRSVSGIGHDDSGAFRVGGNHDGLHARLIKQYASHEVRYFGTWDGTLIAGDWTIHMHDFDDSGVFELWPLSEEVLLEQLVHEDELVKSR